MTLASVDRRSFGPLRCGGSEMRLAPMQRRAWLAGGLASGVVLVGASLSPRRVRAQARADWSPSGPLEGREPRDLSALTPEERIHVPVLTLPARLRIGRSFDLIVQVGLQPHECTEDHHIDWIEVALDERRVFVADLSRDIPFPVVRVPLAVHVASTLTVRARCNQHGVWRTQRALEPA
jgi:superoxide reductase